MIKPILLLLAVISLSCRGHQSTGALNCTSSSTSGCPLPSELEAAEECPPDSRPVVGGGCECSFDHCSLPPVCYFETKLTLVRKATKVPGDCCDVNECVAQKGINCSGVICESEPLKECPKDSYNLPGLVGPCCVIHGGCACLPASCPSPPSCSRPPQVVIIGNKQPGTCCTVYSCPPTSNDTNLTDIGGLSKKKTCEKEGGVLVEEGESWEIGGGCKKCVCRGGVAVCASSCPPLPPNCTDSTIQPGACCPICIHQQGGPPGGCKSGSGMIFENGATWDEDDCTRCTCVGGTPKCQAALCPIVCPNATYVKGECCPRCPNGTHIVTVPPDCPPFTNCTLRCKNGVQKDKSNCLMCRCKEECLLNCPNGFLRDSDGNELCECQSLPTSLLPLPTREPGQERTNCPRIDGCKKKCPHGLKRDPITGCPQCRCHHCKPMPHCGKKCPHGFLPDSRNCPLCKCKSSNAFNSTTNETEGYCLTGDRGEKKDDGEVWFDGCRECYCLGGREMCALVSCPRLLCPEPLLPRGGCCPICPGNETLTKEGASGVVCITPGGGVRREGELWQLGDCVECVCHGGRVLCRGTSETPCPPAPCNRPEMDQCCPKCSQGIPLPKDEQPQELGCGEGRGLGSSWKEGPCISCICMNGEASCYTETCLADTTCITPVQVKDKCCPLCFDVGDEARESETCRVGNVTFSIGDEWEPKECTRCICQEGRAVVCTQTTPCRQGEGLPCIANCNGNSDSENQGGSGSWWSVYLALVCLAGCVAVGVLGLAFRRLCCQSHHKLTLASPPPYHYKYVPTYPAPSET